MSRNSGVAALLVFALLSCEHPREEKQQIVARVGDAVLLRDEVLQSIDTTRKPFEPQMRQYVSSWIKTELLYQEAVQKGFENSPDFQKSMTQVRRQLAIQQLLEHLQETDTMMQTNESLQSYFSQHAAEFFVREEMMKLNIAGFSSRDKANAYSGLLARGNSWENAMAKFLSDSSSAEEIISASRGIYYSEGTILFPELWKVAQTLKTNDVSFPVRTPGGYFIVQMLSSVKKGSAPNFDLVQEEVRARYLRERQQQRLDSLVGTLRSRKTVEIILPVQAGLDSTLNSSHD